MRVMALMVLPLAMMLGGCATVAHGTSQAVPIASSPQGAQVFVDSVSVGVTPLVATVSRKQSHVVSIVRDSFPPVRVVMERNVSPWLLASVFFYLFPAIVDLSNGAAYGFPSDTLRVVLSAGQGAEPHRSRIPTESVATAAVLTGVFGFGSGQRVLGARAWPFFATQLAGGTIAVTGLGMGFAGQDGGEALFTTGLLVVLGSRIWEIADFISVTSERNRVVAAGGSAPTARHRDVSLVPVVDARSKGVALRFGF